MEIIPEKLRHLWSEDEIRILVLCSLLLQIILISFSLFRKRSSRKVLSLVLWLSYLGADAVATLALGNLLSKQNDAVEANTSGDIMAFWAPFLLLHLGGPDTITSYSLEDNELWIRHFLNLVVQVVVAVAIFLESLPSPHVWKPAIVVFAAGILKYGERTASLRSASMDHLRESMLSKADPGPNYAKFMQEYDSLEKAGLKVDIKIEKVPLPAGALITQQEKIKSEAELISIGYHFFRTFKRRTVDLMLTFQDRIENQTFFVQRSWGEAFQLVEVELSFLHDILHTKAVHVHSPRGRATRIAYLGMAILALLLFYHRSGKDSGVFEAADVLITYLLLFVAVGLEIVSILSLIFSDWTIVALETSSRGRLKHPWSAYLKKKFRTPKWGDAIIKLRQGFLSVFPKWLVGDTERWWSNRMRQYDLFGVWIRSYQRTNLDQVLEMVKMKKAWDKFWYVGSNEVNGLMKEHIFKELKAKANSSQGIAAKCKCLRASRGEWVLREKGYSSLKWSIEKKLDESILIWHIATYLCYQKWSIEKKHDESTLGSDQPKTVSTDAVAGENELGEAENEPGDVENEAGSSEPSDKTSKIDYYIKISMEISEYLMYLVVNQPKLLPADVRTIRFIEATCVEVKKFLSNKTTEMTEELQKRRENGDEKKPSTSKATKNSNFRIFSFFLPIKRVLISKAIRKRWSTAITKIHQCFCFCIEVVKEMQPRNKVITPEMEQLGCKKLMEVWAGIDPAVVKGDRSKSVLFDAVRLASEMMEIFNNEVDEENENEEQNNNKEKKKWEVMSSVWVEMLCYAAGNCASYTHARQLSKGGQLLTHVWLLMQHMGIGENYGTEDDHARAKLSVIR